MTAVKTMPVREELKHSGGSHAVRSNTEEFTFRCGGCGAELNWPIGRRSRGPRLRCPECSRRLHLPKAQRAGCPSCGESVSRTLPPHRPSMQCAHCGLLFKAKPPLASAATRRIGRTSSRQRSEAVAVLVSFSIITGLVLLCLLLWFI